MDLTKRGVAINEFRVASIKTAFRCNPVGKPVEIFLSDPVNILVTCGNRATAISASLPNQRIDPPLPLQSGRKFDVTQNL